MVNQPTSLGTVSVVYQLSLNTHTAFPLSFSSVWVALLWAEYIYVSLLMTARQLEAAKASRARG